MGEIIKWPKPSSLLSCTGERLTTRYGGQTEIEQMHRYLMAREWCRDKDLLDVASGEGVGTALLAQVARSAVGAEIAVEAVDPANIRIKQTASVSLWVTRAHYVALTRPSLSQRLSKRLSILRNAIANPLPLALAPEGSERRKRRISHAATAQNLRRLARLRPIDAPEIHIGIQMPDFIQ